MAHRVCPWWLGYWLLFPLRRLYQDPGRLLAPYVKEGMTVLEPGPGMGYFTLELARRVGKGGHVFCPDVQPRMLEVLRRRALKAGLASSIEARLVTPETMGLEDLRGKVDFCLAFAVAHEFPDAKRLFAELFQALKPGAKVLLSEPALHVSRRDYEEELKIAGEAGFKSEEVLSIPFGRSALLVKPATPA